MAQFRQLFPASDCINVGDDVCVIDMKYDRNLEILKHPCRFDGYLVFFCISGKVRITINLTDFDVVEDSLFINFPGDIIAVPKLDESQKASLHFIVMAMTKDYMSGLKVNMPQLMARGVALLNDPCIILTGEERAIAKKYLDLASDILKSNLMYKRECISSLQRRPGEERRFKTGQEQGHIRPLHQCGFRIPYTGKGCGILCRQAVPHPEISFKTGEIRFRAFGSGLDRCLCHAGGQEHAQIFGYPDKGNSLQTQFP